eukprot:CAMPEP_0170065156 /NCGR_PEP_ID=MMETSP0019_2-20121128/5350_1 /TAXON_ID=98059 /ORGANISM="Dinobryon sp., Strain UTEXLB2267" /LENGTH=494 /DNA_ID=CAMNT_0010271957 /DNA_START=61 /DNA_END=1545 /DNA_ORIENTATION=-
MIGIQYIIFYLMPALTLSLFFCSVKERILRPLSFSRALRNFSIKNAKNDDQSEKQRVLVVGGGFGGLYTALQLSKLLRNENAEVFLLDPKDRFVFLPLLYELAVGTASAVEVAPTYDSLLNNSKVKHIQGFAQNIDLKNQRVDYFNVTSGGAARIEDNKTNEHFFLNSTSSSSLNSIHFDALVMAVGIQPKIDLVPGAREHAVPFYRLEDAFALRKRLAAIQRRKRQQGFVRVSVVGGGYSGVEVATTVAQTIGKYQAAVTIIDRNDKVMSSSADHNRASAMRSLGEYGVKVSLRTSVKSVGEGSLTLIDEEGSEYSYSTDLAIFTAGTEQSPLVKLLDVQKDKFGRILTTDTLQLKDYPNVFALGDCSSVEGVSNPSTAQVAMQQAGTTAGNLAKWLKSNATGSSEAQQPRAQRLEAFKYLPLGEMLTLGMTDGAISSLGGLVQLSGPLAALGRRVVYAVRMPTATQQAKALLTAGAVTSGKLFQAVFGRKDT